MPIYIHCVIQLQERLQKVGMIFAGKNAVRKSYGRYRGGGVYVSIFVSYLFRSHASSKPHKKKEKKKKREISEQSYPNMHVVV